MKITKRTSKPVDVTHKVDDIQIETLYGSQSTDFRVTFFRNEKEIHSKDVHSLEDGILYVAKLAGLTGDKGSKRLIVGTDDTENFDA